MPDNFLHAEFPNISGKKALTRRLLEEGSAYEIGLSEDIHSQRGISCVWSYLSKEF